MSQLTDDEKFNSYKTQCKTQKQDKSCKIQWEKYTDKSGKSFEKCLDDWCFECNIIYHQACSSQIKDIDNTYISTDNEDKIPTRELLQIINTVKIEKQNSQGYENAFAILKALKNLKKCEIYRKAHHYSCIRKLDENKKYKTYEYGPDTNHKKYLEGLKEVLDEASKKIKAVAEKKEAYDKQRPIKVKSFNEYLPPKSFRSSAKKRALKKINFRI
jgi:hypothetical protein